MPRTPSALDDAADLGVQVICLARKAPALNEVSHATHVVGALHFWQRGSGHFCAAFHVRNRTCSSVSRRIGEGLLD